MRETIKEQMSGISNIKGKPKRIGNNLIRYVDNEGNTHIRLHRTNIVSILPNGAHIFNSNGWQTLTTKKRMNEYMPAAWSIYQHKGKWFVVNRILGVKYDYHDGYTINYQP